MIRLMYLSLASSLFLCRPVEVLGFLDSNSISRRYPFHNCARKKNQKSADIHGRDKSRKVRMDEIADSLGLQTVSGAHRHRSKPHKNDPIFEDKDQVKNASEIDLSTQLCYCRMGHAVLRDFINPEYLQQIRKELESLMIDEEILAWRQKVQVASNSLELAKSCTTVEQCQEELHRLGIFESLPFLQHFNTFQRIDMVRKLAYELGRSASVFMDVSRVRLYQDSVFWKRTGDGPTPWHVDARMAPFDTSNFISFWIPLQDIPKDGSALLFCSKSHSDVALPYWNSLEKSQEDGSEWDRLEHRYPKDYVHYMPMKLSDLTVHSGWTLHCADGAHGKSIDRMALAISFVDADAEIRQDALDDSGKGDNEDRWSYQDWVREVPPRKKFYHPLVPLVCKLF